MAIRVPVPAASRKNGVDTLANDTIAPDMDGDSYDNKEITFTGAATLTPDFSGAPAGEYNITVKQDGTGGHAITLAGASGNAPEVDTTASASTVVRYYWTGSGAYYETTVVPTNRKEGESSIAYSATPTLDFTALNYDNVGVGALTGNIDFSANGITFRDPGEYHIRLVQDGTGGRTVTWPALNGTTPVVDGAANAESVIKLYWDGSVIHTLTI